MTKEPRNYHDKYILTLVFVSTFFGSFGFFAHSVFADSVIDTISMGTNPWGIGINSNTDKIYVADPNNGTIAVIDGSTNIVVSTIPVSALGVVVNQITNTIYAMNSNSVTVINGSTNMIVKNIAIPLPDLSSRLFDIGLNQATNTIYVDMGDSRHFGNSGGGPYQIAIINGTTNNFVNAIGAGALPSGISANPNTNKIYIANNRGNNISVIDGSTNSIIDDINVSSNPNSVAVNPNTDMIYVTEIPGETLTVINGTTNSVVTEIPAGYLPIAVGVNPVTNKIYVADQGSGQVTVIDGASNQVVDKLPIGSQPMDIAVNPNNNRIYVTNYQSSTTSVIDGSSNSPMPPTGLTATAISSSQINLSWITPPNEGGSIIIGYEIERSTDNGSTWSTIVGDSGTTSTTYSDTGLIHSTTYTYRVSAINSVGTSQPSNTALTTTFNTVPSQPTGLTASAQLLKINLSWNAPSDNGGTSITGYIIERSTDNGSTWSTLVANTGSTGTTYSDSNILPLTTYTYRVSAINNIGTGNPSNTASASTPSVSVPSSPTLP